MVKTKTANGQDQDRLGQDQLVKKMVLRPRPVLRPSSLPGRPTTKHSRAYCQHLRVKKNVMYRVLQKRI